MKNLESRLQTIDKHIRKLSCVVTADANSENSQLLSQLRVLREEIKTKAKKDFLEVQKDVLDTFRTLMEQMATLSFYSSEAEKDPHDIEKAISQLNKIKGTISENILGLEENKDEEGEQKDSPKEKENEDSKSEASAVTASVDDDVRKYIEDCNGKHYVNYAEWYSEVLCRKLKPEIHGSVVFAVDENGETLGKYVTDEMQGCLFDNIDDYDKAFEEIDDDEVEEEDEDVVEETDDED